MSESDPLREAKLEALAEFAAGAGHEINNPVAAIKGRVELLLREEADPQRKRMLLKIGAQAERIRDMIGDLMLFARSPEAQPRSLDLKSMLDEVASHFADHLRARRISLDWQLADDVTIWADETQLCVVISELLRNSIRFSPEGATIGISSRRETCEGTAWAILSMSDVGPGLSETDREHLFDPFYSGRQAGRGLGFGLCKCWRIVTMHGGQITAEPYDPTGLVMSVHWPCAAAFDKREA